MHGVDLKLGGISIEDLLTGVAVYWGGKQWKFASTTMLLLCRLKLIVIVIVGAEKDL